MYKELILELTQNNEYVKIQSPCTGEEIEKAEKAVGYPFPKELRELLYELDGDKYLLFKGDNRASHIKQRNSRNVQR